MCKCIQSVSFPVCGVSLLARKHSQEVKRKQEKQKVSCEFKCCARHIGSGFKVSGRQTGRHTAGTP